MADRPLTIRDLQVCREAIDHKIIHYRPPQSMTGLGMGGRAVLKADLEKYLKLMDIMLESVAQAGTEAGAAVAQAGTETEVIEALIARMQKGSTAGKAAGAAMSLWPGTSMRL